MGMVVIDMTVDDEEQGRSLTYLLRFIVLCCKSCFVAMRIVL